MAIYIKCKICGDELEYSDEVNRLGCAFKICPNCINLGPEKSGQYVIPKGSDLPLSVHDRYSTIVPDKEIPRIFQEFFDQVIECSKGMREKYGHH